MTIKELKNYDEIKNRIFRRFRLSKQYTLKQLAGNKDKCDAYITLRAIEIIKKETPFLEITDYVFHQSTDKDVVYATITTKPNVNHPYLVFAHIQDSVMYLVNPFGKSQKEGQRSLDDFVYLLKSENKKKLSEHHFYALYILFGESIRIRKKQILYNDKYSLLECSNIKLCQRKVRTIKREVGKRKKTVLEGKKELQQLEEYYQKKSVNFLSKYFNMLEKADYNEAYLFLKGKSSKYYKKQRLNTFFAKTKKIVGHLEIFITIYEMLFKCIERYEEVKKLKNNNN